MVRRAGAAALLLALGGCALTPQFGPSAPVASHDDACLALFAELDEAIDRAGMRDGQHHRPAGFPYLRVSRPLASFANALSAAQQTDWLAHLRELDREARDIELGNLGDAAWLARRAELNACAASLLAVDQADPARMAALRARAAVPDDYSVLARTLSVYPLGRVFLAQGIKGYQRAVREDFARPLTQLEALGELMLWRPDAAQRVDQDTAVALARAAPRDALGIPRLDADQWQQLFAAWSPAFVIDTASPADQPGQPRPGAGFESTPTVYLQPGWTRFGDEVLVQLSWVIWFSERVPKSALDPYAGALDGVIWRLTLGADGRPLVYDSIHPCGCYHLYFPARALERQAPARWQEPALQPQGVVAWTPPAIWINAGDHYIRRVLPLPLAEDLAGPARALESRPLDELRSLLAEDGGRRSLYRADGLIRGTQRPERWWLWPSGVISPGAMRQWGRQATAFVGRAHFDEAFGLERIYLP